MWQKQLQMNLGRPSKQRSSTNIPFIWCEIKIFPIKYVCTVSPSTTSMSNSLRGKGQSFDIKAVNSVGGSGGRANGAGNSFHPRLHGERKAHWRTASSRKGMLPKNANRCVNLRPQIKLFIFTFRFCLFCQLNIYTPLPQSSQAQVVPERSGIIQSGITTAREGIQPFAQASKVLFWYYISHYISAFSLISSARQILLNIVSNLPRLHTGRYEWGADKD